MTAILIPADTQCTFKCMKLIFNQLINSGMWCLFSIISLILTFRIYTVFKSQIHNFWETKKNMLAVLAESVIVK